MECQGRGSAVAGYLSFCHGDTGALDFEVSSAVCKLMWCGFFIG